MSKLILRGLMFHGYHGVKEEEEKKLGQKFVIDVDAWMYLRPAGRSDNLHDTVSYTAIYRIVKEPLGIGSGTHLDDHIDKALSDIISSLGESQEATCSLAVQGSLDYLGFEIERNRSSLASQ